MFKYSTILLLIFSSVQYGQAEFEKVGEYGSKEFYFSAGLTVSTLEKIKS